MPPHLDRRTLLASAAGLGGAVFGGALLGGATAQSPADPTAGAKALNLRGYGASGDGRADDTAAVHRAIADTCRSGGALDVPPGRYLLHEPPTVTAPISVRGAGDSSVFIAGRPMPELIRVTIPQRGLFSDIKFDGNNLADRCVTQSVATETSVGTRWVRCKFTGARNVQVVNDGCEDNSYVDCTTDGDEDRPGTVRDALSVRVPNGTVRIIGGEWFGRCTFDVQHAAITDATIGPLFIHNPDGRNDALLTVTGCYLYAGGVHGDCCVSTSTSLSNIRLSGCFLAASNPSAFINGHLPDVFIRVQDCSFVQPASVSDGTVSFLLTASGTGVFIVDGGRISAQPGSTVHAFRPVDGGSIQIATAAPCLGLT